jgi:hypothetical protein
MFLNEIQLSNKSYCYILISRRSYDTLSPQKRGTFLRCIFKDEQNENKLSGNFYIQFHFKFLFKQGFLIRTQVLWIIRNLQALFGIKIKLEFVFKQAWKQFNISFENICSTKPELIIVCQLDYQSEYYDKYQQNKLVSLTRFSKQIYKCMWILFRMSHIKLFWQILLPMYVVKCKANIKQKVRTIKLCVTVCSRVYS